MIIGPPALAGGWAWTAVNLMSFRDGKVIEIVNHPTAGDALARAGRDPHRDRT